MTELKIKTPYETHRFKYSLLVSDVVNDLKEILKRKSNFIYEYKETTIIPHDVLVNSIFEIYETE